MARFRYSSDFSLEKLEGLVQEDFKTALKCLRSLYETTQESSNVAMCFMRNLSRKVESVYGNEMSKILTGVRDYVCGLHENGRDSLVHGDFTPWNILLLEDPSLGSETGLLDWELASVNPYTILDYGRFSYYYLTELEGLGIFKDSREKIIRKLFIERSHWLSRIVIGFLRDGLENIASGPVDINRLMQFTILHDAILQDQYSIKPSAAIGSYYLRILRAFEKEAD